MLTKIRSGLDSVFVTILLSILVAAFAVWGMGPGLLSGFNKAAAKVGDQEISPQYLASAVEAQAAQIQQQLGNQLTLPEIITRFSIDYQVLSELVAQAALSQAAADMGVTATEAQLVELLGELEAFQLPSGGFSRDLLQRYLARQGIQEQEFLADLQSGLARDQIIAAMVQDLPLSSALAGKLYAAEAERRDLTLVNIGTDLAPEIPAPDDAALKLHYQATKADYVIPERRDYQYIILSPAVFEDTVEITEDDYLDAYDSRLDEFVQPELRRLLQISLPDAETAADFIARVNAGEAFGAVAEELTSFTADEVELGDLTRDDLVADFSEAAASAVFDLPQGGLTAPIEGFAGVDVFRVQAITAGESRPLEDVRALLEPGIRRDKAIDLMFALEPDINDAVQSAPSLAEVADSFEAITLASVSGVTRGGSDGDGTQRLNQASEFRILAAAFDAAEGDPADIQNLVPDDDNAGYFWVEVTSVAEPEQIPFETVRSRVEAAWRSEQRLLAVGALTDTTLEALKSSQDAEAIAADIGATLFSARSIRRTAQDDQEKLAASIRSLAFELAEGDIDYTRSADGEGYVIVRVDAVTPGDPTADPDAVTALRDQLQQSMLNDVLAQYQSYLLEEYPPQINETMVQALFRQSPDG